MGKRILLVDDEILILKSLQADLEQAGYEIVVAANGEDALAQLAGKACNLVVTDLMMDGMSGVELLEKIREHDSELPVIIITGYGELETAIAALRLGAADYLLKPFHTEELLLRIQNCLEKQELQEKVTFYEKILPICMFCKKIRNDIGKKPGAGDWVAVDTYLNIHTDLKLSHGICRKCAVEHYGYLDLEEENED